MIFAGRDFWIFLPLALLIYHGLGRRSSKYNWLLFCSWLFYAKWSPGYLWVLLMLTVWDYLAARLIEQSATPERRRIWLIASILANLGFLASFKYTVFLYDNLLSVVGVCGVTVPERTWDILLPLGISFHTFQGMSYTWDVYRGQIQAVRNFRDYALFVAFFPQLAAGPIVRAVEFLPQMVTPPRVTAQQIEQGLRWIVLGLFKKLVIADHLHELLVHPVFSEPGMYDHTHQWLATLAWAIQIYCDFSGYTDIALGCALLFGFRLPGNFHLPYLATSIADFWRRWHISFSFWLRDYLYYPLGGSRGSEWRTVANLLIVFVLCGLWHGASWNWLIYGLFNGILMIAYRWFDRLCRNAAWRTTRFWHFCAWLVTFCQLCFGLILIRMPDWERGWIMMHSWTYIPEMDALATLPAAVWLLLFLGLAEHVWAALPPSFTAVADWLGQYTLVRAWAWSILVMSVITLNASVQQSFIYIAF